MFASFTKQLEDRSATLRVALYGPKDDKPHTDYRLGPPRERHHRPFLQLNHMGGSPRIAGDGLIVDLRGRVGSLQTSDCWSVVLFSSKRPIALLLHAGRMQLRPTKDKKGEYYGNYGRTILSVAMRFWQEDRHVSIAETRFLLVAGICGRHFVHDTKSGRAKAAPFYQYFAEEVFCDEQCTQLDLGLAIRKMLRSYHIDNEQIEQIGACTFETPSLGSLRRAGATTPTSERQNLITVEWT